MTDPTSLSWSHKYRSVIGWALLATWLVYSTTLFPILDEYLALSLFTLTISVLGLLGAVLALRDHKLWIRVSSVAAALLVARYFIYWYDLRESLLVDSPDMNLFAVLGEIAKSGILIFEHRLSQGEILGATLTIINEFVMPLLQIGVLIFAGVSSILDRRIRHQRVGP
jgi:exosortase/archaeosortase